MDNASRIVKLAISMPCRKERVPFKIEALLAHCLCGDVQTRQAWMHTKIKLEIAAYQSPAKHG